MSDDQEAKRSKPRDREEPASEERASDAPSEAAPESELSRWRTPIVLLVLTFASTLYVGAAMALELDPAPESATEFALYLLANPRELLAGWTFAVPLMAILFAHEMGHYVAGKLHKVDISPPYFIPVPFFLLGTMGAVIRMKGAIKTRDALLDIGAAGPLAGMVVAIPVLVYGLHTSPVEALSAHAGEEIWVEGRNILYLAILYLLKGPIPEGYDVWINPTATAGWAGLLVTQINLIPVGQLDGGHIAYALFGKRQDGYSRLVHRALPFVALLVAVVYLVPAWQRGERGDALFGEAIAGAQWLVWWLVLSLMARFAGGEHPPTGPEPLSRGRKAVAIGTLVLFALLFMPSWIYVPDA